MCVHIDSANAEDGGKEFMHIDAAWDAEFNFLNSGNSRVFSTRDSYGTTYPAKETVSSADRAPLAWRTGLAVTADHKSFEIWVSPYSNWSNFGWPKSVGLKYSLLFKLAYVDMKLGLYHHSAHNLVEERYGKGTSTTGVHAVWNVMQEKGWQWNVWGTYNFHDDNESPYVFTSRAKEMAKKELGKLAWAAGSEIRLREDRVELCIPMQVMGKIDGITGLASFRGKSVLFYKIQKDVGAGPFFEYNANLRDTGKFGRDEWLAGIAAKSEF